MTESVINIVQLVITGFCAAVCFVRAIISWKRTWLQLGLFYSVFFFGDLYWQLYLTFYGETPPYSFIPYLCWYSADLFLLMLVVTHCPCDWKKHAEILWLIPVFTAAMCVYYMTFGDYISNLIAAFLMCCLLWRSIGGLAYLHKKPPGEKSARLLLVFVVLFCVMEYAAWTASCFFEGDTLKNPYYWFDILQTAVLFLFLPAQRKAVRR